MLNHEQVQAAIARAGANWQAGPTSMTRLTDEQRRARLGVDDRLRAVSRARQSSADHTVRTALAAIASAWDWRDHNGVTAIRDQGNCGSCVSFACVAALESILLIKHGYTADLSEGDLHFCSSHGANCDGWNPNDAMQELAGRGVCDEACVPYNPPHCNSSSTRDSRAVHTGQPQSFVATASFKTIISTNRPLVACFDVYDDFYSYLSGVYHHVTGDSTSSHCVEVVGYSDADSCWIAKNSWGPYWGENGFFRIGYGECGFDDAMWQVSDPISLPVGVAFQANTGHLWTAGPLGSRDHGLGMKAGTSLSIKGTAAGDAIAFQANTGNLWTVGPEGNRDHGLGMMAGTSPSLTESLGGYTVAFQANTGHLWTTGPDGTQDHGWGMMAGTSPSVANIADVNGGWECAFQANTGNLWIVGHDYRGDMHLGMMAGTSPSIAARGRVWECAFQANTGHLWTVGPDGNHDHGLGMMAGTSPSVTALGASWQCAFQANTGNLWVIGADNRGDTHLGMMRGTSPSIREVAGGWEVAFQANTGHLWTLGPDGAKDHGLGMLPNTSPSLARPA